MAQIGPKGRSLERVDDFTYQKMKEIAPIPRKLRFFRPGHPTGDRLETLKMRTKLVTRNLLTVLIIRA